MGEGTEAAGTRLRAEVLLVILATGLGLIENLLPRPVPFLKPGLANIVTVAAVIRYGTFTGLRVNVIRATAAALFMGTIATPTYLLSMAGGVVSATVMGSVRRLFSVTGISITGAVCSMWTQLLTASLLIPGLPLRNLLVPVTLWGFLSGTFTGIIAAVLLRKGFPWTVEDRG